ncbi:hypothetical protein [Fimbriiglobus ruber]|uniref:Uncharacterized protein n=1 Tax=Fimbriiglobus ruber TaxID=1908690 RepID=A0A225E2X1_9BACT|nr:hypothetical protein [Fimbriiglobus ruber]OWK43829.1 hypothetical protein FRUB_03428 [Fimbriiglobus ruber]
MKKFILAVAVVAGICAAAQDASAFGLGPGPFYQGPGNPPQSWFRKQPVPAFQAAPWYLYWPYDSHFQTPSPLTGPYYAPPASGGLSNPYFPSTPYVPAR